MSKLTKPLSNVVCLFEKSHNNHKIVMAVFPHIYHAATPNDTIIILFAGILTYASQRAFAPDVQVLPSRGGVPNGRLSPQTCPNALTAAVVLSFLDCRRISRNSKLCPGFSPGFL